MVEQVIRIKNLKKKQSMKINRIIFNVFLPLLALGLMLGACQKNVDLLTPDAKTGGLLLPTEIIPYKLGITPTFNVDIVVPQGPAIKTIHVTYYYMRSSDTTQSNILKFDIPVNGENVTAEVTKSLPYTWATIREGIVLPTAPQIPATDLDPTISDFIGDYWLFSYTVTLEDGRELINNRTTKVSVANFFAGTYDVELLYFHPTAGGTYPTEAYGGVRKMKKDLIAASPFVCYTWFGVWENNFTIVNIDASNKVTLTFNRADAVSGDPNDPTKLNSYDPETGVIQIYYFYPGSGGNRIFWEKFTPKE
jgi:hypothetical protein